MAGSVVFLAAPELTGDQLVGVTEMAGIAGIGASTLRAYLSRDEGDVPLPQATVSSRSMWAQPVAEDWAELRRRSSEGLIESVAADRDNHTQPAGTTAVWKQFSRSAWDRIHDRLRVLVGILHGCDPNSSVAVPHAQSIVSSEGGQAFGFAMGNGHEAVNDTSSWTPWACCW